MAPSVLAAISLDESDDQLQQLSYLGHVLATVSHFGPALSFLQKHFAKFSIYFDVTKIASLEEVESLLDAGAAKVFVSLDQFKPLSQNISSDRLVVSMDTNAMPKLEEIFQSTPKAVKPGLHFNEDLPAKALSEFALIYVSTAGGSLASLSADAIPIVSASRLTTDPSLKPGLIPTVDVLLRNSVIDQSTGLYATSVSDQQGVGLGLVWSSRESIAEALRTGTGVYQSRKRGLWFKGQSSGDTQELIRIGFDCDRDCLQFIVKQSGRGFCHTGDATCFGPYRGMSRLMKTLESREVDAPAGSYTARLFNEPKLLSAKIMEEAEELCQATSKDDIAAEAADLLYFALTKCIAADVSLADIETNLDLKSLKIKRRKGDAKRPWAEKAGLNGQSDGASNDQANTETVKEAASVSKSEQDDAGIENGRIRMRRFVTATTPPETIQEALQRPSQKSNDTIMKLVHPIIADVRDNGDSAVLKYTHKFEKAASLNSPVMHAPFPDHLMKLPEETIAAINTSFHNIQAFHAAQKESKPLEVETMRGVVCSRFSRPIERVGLYIPGGTAVLPSTALMLGVPAQVAGCKKIVLATPPRADGTVTPEIVYIAHRVGAESIVLAGGAQAVAAMAYGTQSISKVDKILGPGNQFVTAAKMIVSNDTSAGVGIDMPAGPSEVLVVADRTANPAFVASDLLSQAEHGTDSQVICIAVDLDDQQLLAIEDELHAQAMALPRVDIVRGAIDHSVTFVVKDIAEALALSNQYAPEHLILQVENAEDVVPLVQNAGSVFIGSWTPESVGDYSAGVNHSLPTYGYARQYSGVNLGSFTKHITSSNLTPEGLRNVSGAVMQLATVEGLEAHRRAVSIRIDAMNPKA